MKEKTNKSGKKIKRFILFLFLLIIILVSIFILCAYVFDIKVKAVIIHGNSIITDNEVLNEASIENYPNFFLLKEKNIKKQLKNNPYIKEANLKRDIFLNLHIYIAENKPLFIREDTNMIVFNSKKETKETKKILDIPTLINYVPNTKYDELIKKLNLIDYNLLKKASQIKYDPTKYDEDRFLLYMNDSNKVYINLPKFKSFNNYDKMVTKFEGKTGTLYLDSGNYFEIDKSSREK